MPFSEVAYRAEQESAGGQRPEPGEIRFKQVISVFRRRYRLIASIAALSLAASVVIALLVPIKYTGKAQIVIEPQRTPQYLEDLGENSIEAAARQKDDANIDALLDTHVAALASPGFLRQVLESFHEHPVGAPAPSGQSEGKGLPSPHGGQEENLGASGYEKPPSGLAGMKRRLFVWINAFKKRFAAEAPLFDVDDPEAKMKVLRDRRSRIVTIAFTADSPLIAAAVPNRVVELYVADRRSQKREAMQQRLAQIEKRIGVLKGYAASASGEARRMIHPGSSYIAGAFPDQRMRELLTEAASARLLLPKLEQQQSYLREELANIKSDAEVLSLASPPELPSSLNPILFIFPAFLASLIGGFWVAVLLERADQRLRSESDVTETLGIPCLGFVPELPRRQKGSPMEYMLAQPYSVYSEAIRSIVASLRLLRRKKPPKSILICSSLPSEGKTTLAASLATHTALLGTRVILVNIDCGRTPNKQRFGIKLTGRALVLPHLDLPLEAEIEKVPTFEFDYLSVRTASSEPLSLFADHQLPRIIRELRERYDCVFIDGPPLSVFAEARLLATLADEVLFVVRWGSSRRDIIENAVKFLRGPNPLVENISAVVTRVDLKQHAQYRYGDIGEYLRIYQQAHSTGEKIADDMKSSAFIEGPAKPSGENSSLPSRSDS